MVGQSVSRPALLIRLRWTTAVFLALALMWIVVPTAHASTHVAAHTSMHLADGNNQGGNNQGDNNQNDQNDRGGTATPELPSGVLFSLALVPVALVARWRQRKRGGSVASH